jgi:hypothetical protein
MRSFTLFLFALIAFPHGVHADPLDWAEGASGYYTGGMTGSAFNHPYRWNKVGGDWVDANGVAHGTEPFAVMTYAGGDGATVHEFDVTALVKKWVAGQLPQRGFRIEHARQASLTIFKWGTTQGANPAELVIDGRLLRAYRDSCADVSTTVPSCGWSREIKSPAYIYFDLSGVTSVGTARLRLHPVGYTGTAPTKLQVFAATTPYSSSPVPPSTTAQGVGFSRLYPGDVGIQGHPAVYIADNFDSGSLNSKWTAVALNKSKLTNQPIDGVRPFHGYSLNCILVGGLVNGGCVVNYEFLKAGLPREPKEAWMRFMMATTPTFAANENQGGKYPGFMASYLGTRYQGGHSGARSNGSNGFSSRGSYFRPFQDQNNPLFRATPIGVYVYHVDQKAIYGDVIVNNDPRVSTIKPGEWVCVEQHLRINTVNNNGTGNHDGVIELFVNDQPVLQKRDFLFTVLPQIEANRAVQVAWFGSFSGGQLVLPRDMSVLFDNFVVARERIGCPRGGSQPREGSQPLSAPSGLRTVK